MKSLFQSKNLIILLLTLILILHLSLPVCAEFSVTAKAAVLMDPVSGQVLYSQNAHAPLPPASVTKLMTMLIIMEAVAQKRVAWTDTIRTSTEASKMGGSQVYLREGEEMPLKEMFKAIAIVSANDASAAVAEHLFGSTIDFIDYMNKKAKELGLKNTHFANETGLPDPQHYSSAYDLAVISKELLKYPEITKYTSIWLDTLRNGKFMLKNTNNLLREYAPADGLKTGHTNEAKFCLAATAQKNDFRLVSVILGTPSDRKRIESTKRLLNYGFRNYKWTIVKKSGTTIKEAMLKNASPEKFDVKLKKDLAVLVEREKADHIKTKLIMNEKLKLPLKSGDTVGRLQAIVDDKIIGTTEVYTPIAIKEANLLVKGWRALATFFKNLLSGKLFN